MFSASAKPPTVTTKEIHMPPTPQRSTNGQRQTPAPQPPRRRRRQRFWNPRAHRWDWRWVY
ncbi:hypothetical protein GOOTI_154_00020 [Gordonia otitidis NBRC 100426]|uniref:Uncharacterized protein n=1 Tax=Gordonia otitidis (strain DSM 44809 / CCUG 52243 / JCM 12355 / NBRC 100426 / IFM 10032) TaxID=1108044 RepID=H5TPA7_GORO1|nr:hypothetical protein GOOTI_154_00020 [Gordonia otitidis NBRC 100426]